MHITKYVEFHYSPVLKPVFYGYLCLFFILNLVWINTFSWCEWNRKRAYKNGGRNAENFFLAFKDVFWKFSSRWLPLTGSGQIQRKTKNPVFITFLGLKDCGGFKGRREMSRYQVVPFAISANFGCNLSAKVYAGENPYKNGDFLVGF